jgi:hypothetical protein
MNLHRWNPGMPREQYEEWRNMRSSMRMAIIGMCLGVISLQACQHYIPDFDGTYVANSADIQADRKTVNDIVSAFKQAEAALQRRDIGGIMELYSDSYKSQSFDKLTLRTVWAELFQEHRDFSTTHVFTQVKVEAQSTPQTAQIVCTGSLWAISNKTNARVNLDSWFGEVHYMVLENGKWRIRGHAWEVPGEKQPNLDRPPHPFF